MVHLVADGNLECVEVRGAKATREGMCAERPQPDGEEGEQASCHEKGAMHIELDPVLGRQADCGSSESSRYFPRCSEPVSVGSPVNPSALVIR